MSIPAPLPPGAAAVQEARQALVAVSDAADEMRAILPQSNDPRHHAYFEPLLDHLALVVGAGLDGNLVNVANDILNLKSALRRQKLTARDPELDARTPSRRAIAASVGLLGQELDNALEAFSALGIRPSAAEQAILIVPASEVGTYLGRLAERLNVLEEALSDLGSAARKADAALGNNVAQKGLVTVYVQSMITEVSAAKFETNVASNNEIAAGTDFNALERAITAIGKTASELKQAMRSMGEYFSSTVADASQSVVRGAARVRRGFASMVRILAPKRRPRTPAAPSVPPADFDLERVKDMILQGQAPPDSWVPFIAALAFPDRIGLSDVRAIASLTALKSLSLRRTQVSDVSPLSGLSGLTNLDLEGTQVSDVSPLSGLTGLTSLVLWGTQVSDLSPLSGLTGLTNLDLMGTQVSDVSPLSGLTGLTSLVLRGTQVSDVSPLSGLIGLTRLDLEGTQVSDLSPLSDLTALVSLDLRGTQVSDVSPLSGLAGLTGLALGGTQVSDVSPLSGLTGLKSLALGGTQVSDVSPLSGLTGLTMLFLRRTQVSDVSPLSGLTALVSLDLWDTQVSDVSALDHLVDRGLVIQWGGVTRKR